MIEVYYLDIRLVQEELYMELLEDVDSFVRYDSEKYHSLRDKMHRLFGRIIVEKYHELKGKPFRWKDWKITSNGKPYLLNGIHFNITHSHDYVVVAFSDKRVGVDIELITEIDTQEILNHFHVDEISHLETSTDHLNEFYRIWTRKEAYLKALGIGMMSGLNKESTIENTIHSNGMSWYVHSIDLFSDYHLAICTEIEHCKFNFHQLSKGFFQKNQVASVKK
jgi:Phosphopantetheinyl transferase